MKNIITYFTLFLSAYTIAQPSGSLDPTFGNGGKVITSINGIEDKAYGIAIQSDNKILVAGYTSNALTGKDFICLRYNTNGTLDSTFGTYGFITTDIQLGSDDIAYSIALQSDGKIILGGYSDNGTDKEAALIRYTSNGIIDSIFGVNGIVITDFDSFNQDEIKVVKIHPLTGNIIVGGSAVVDGSHSKPVVARYLNNGNLDSTFNNIGIKLLWVTNLDYQYEFSVEDLTVQSNGKISMVGWRNFASGQWSHDLFAGRINSDGTMDNTFSTIGVDTYNGGFSGNDVGYSLILKPNGTMLIAGGGYQNNFHYDFVALEITPAGGVGTMLSWTTFGGSTDEEIAYAFVEDNDGSFVLAGYSGTSSTKAFAIAKINANGTPDNSFGTNGKVTTTFNNNTFNECFDMQIQTDNKIVAVGYSGDDIAIARYLGNGLPQLEGFQLTAPTNLAVNQNYASINLNWTDAFGATSYSVELDTNQNFTNPQAFTSSTSTYQANNLLPNTLYYWRVRASDGVNLGQYSTSWSFTTNSLENFSLTSPANNAVNQEFSAITLDWSNAVGAMNYEIQIDTNQNFTSNPQTSTVTNSTESFSNLQPYTDYYWHVRASNNGTTYGQWSSVWKFKTKQSSGLSVNEIDIDQIKIYPNPASQAITIELEQPVSECSYSILDLTGKTVKTGNIKSKQTFILIGELSQGSYYLIFGENKTRILKLIKE